MVYKMNTEFTNPSKIKIVGIGNSGNKILEHMMKIKPDEFDYVYISDEDISCGFSKVPKKMFIFKVEGFCGPNGNPDVITKFAWNKCDDISTILSDAEIVIIVAGMGGTTGAGAAPVVAEIAKDLGIICISVVTMPFHFEGERRRKIAETGIIELTRHTDFLVVLPLDNRLIDGETVKCIFSKADKYIIKTIHHIIDTFGLNSSELNK